MSDFIPEKIITGEQIKGARAMLRLDQKQFAALTHITVGAVKRIERTRGPITLAAGMLEAVRAALEAAGLEMIDAGHYEATGGPGIRFAGQPVAGGEVIDLDEAVEELGPKEQQLPASPDKPKHPM
jgi:transcriptional regulator with XRE-family HTH domain